MNGPLSGAVQQDAAPIRILLVEDHLLVRTALRMLIDATPSLRVVGEASNCADGLAQAARERPDIVLLDLVLGAESGLDLLPELARTVPDARVIVLSGVQDVNMRRQAIRLGAMGLVHKDAAAEVLLKAIERVHRGEAWIDRMLTADALRHAALMERANIGENDRIASLTPRERELVALVGEGLKNRQITERLKISEATVRNHLTSIFSKLEVGDRFELALYAYRHRLAKLPVEGQAAARPGRMPPGTNGRRNGKV
jgi:DNA-binding NarL/FixJ family response regulator